MGRPRLVLGSACPRRLALLRQIGIDPDEVHAPGVAENPAKGTKGELPPRIALRRATARLNSVPATGAFVLTAGTVVACGRRVLPRAADEATARRCLALLSGRRHRVWTAVAVRPPAGPARTRIVRTTVQVKRLGAAEVDGFVASGEWRDQAGGYALPGRFYVFVKAVHGSPSNVSGLPLAETAAVLRGLGFPT